jgi:hypothetical protein
MVQALTINTFSQPVLEKMKIYGCNFYYLHHHNYWKSLVSWRSVASSTEICPYIVTVRAHDAIRSESYVAF